MFVGLIFTVAHSNSFFTLYTSPHNIEADRHHVFCRSKVTARAAGAHFRTPFISRPGPVRKSVRLMVRCRCPLSLENSFHHEPPRMPPVYVSQSSSSLGLNYSPCPQLPDILHSGHSKSFPSFAQCRSTFKSGTFVAIHQSRQLHTAALISCIRISEEYREPLRHL